MASRLEELPAAAPRGAKPKYPWSEWTDGSAWLVLADEDYPSASHRSFVAVLHGYASRRGLKVTTRKHVDAEGTQVGVAFQFTPDGTAP